MPLGWVVDTRENPSNEEIREGAKRSMQGMLQNTSRYLIRAVPTAAGSYLR
jgi:hypothetical protein